MIAIVDRETQLRVVIGAAPSTSLSRGIGDADRESGFDQPHRRRQPGEAGPRYRRSREAHRVTSNRATVHSKAGLLTFTRRRGGAQPTASIRLSSFE